MRVDKIVSYAKDCSAKDFVFKQTRYECDGERLWLFDVDQFAWVVCGYRNWFYNWFIHQLHTEILLSSLFFPPWLIYFFLEAFALFLFCLLHWWFMHRAFIRSMSTRAVVRAKLLTFRFLVWIFILWTFLGEGFPFLRIYLLRFLFVEGILGGITFTKFLVLVLNNSTMEWMGSFELLDPCSVMTFLYESGIVW